MKTKILSAFLLIGLVFSVNAQEISKNALGLRIGDNDGFGGEISYQRGLSSNNRLEFDLGWRNSKDVDAFKKALLQKGFIEESVNEATSHKPIKPDSKEVNIISGFTRMREKFVADFINKHKLDADALSKFVLKGSLRDRMDVGTAMAGNPGNKYEKE